jgi:hypothetical protein
LRDDTQWPGALAAGHNTVFSGEVVLRINSNSGIPRVPGTPDDQPKVDDAQWNSPYVSSIGVTVVAQKVTPK